MWGSSRTHGAWHSFALHARRLRPKRNSLIFATFKMADEHVSLTAQCLCKKHTFTAPVPAAALPLEASCCHCTSCRHATGSLYFVDVEWPNPEEDLSSLKKYSLSKNINIFFCGTCSTPHVLLGDRPWAKAWRDYCRATKCTQPSSVHEPHIRRRHCRRRSFDVAAQEPGR